MHRSLVGGIFELLPLAAVAAPSGIGIDIGIAAVCGCFEKAIMFADGFSHPVPNTEIDPLTVPPPVFRFPRFGLFDPLIYQVEQSLDLSLIQSPPLVPTENRVLKGKSADPGEIFRRMPYTPRSTSSPSCPLPFECPPIFRN